jgi:NAD(P)-dependent dehydrogenase (short-subunit alcohol dehydrogenase family)
VRVNSTHPGLIDTVMLEKNSAEVNARIPDVTPPLGRKGSVDELAESTLFLASDASSYVNGRAHHRRGHEYLTLRPETSRTAAFGPVP